VQVTETVLVAAAGSSELIVMVLALDPVVVGFATTC
jgi:hypothetical protein